MTRASTQQFRAPAVAGMFYPDDPREIQHVLDDWLAEVDVPRQRWRAALVPHAGWVYSGHLAAAVFARITFPSTLIVLCPKHHPGGPTWAVAPWQRWLFPGGGIDVDVKLVSELADAVPGLEVDHRPHVAEHAIEVQLPILARLAPAARIVPVTIGQCDLQQCAQFADAMAQIVRNRLDSVLFVISSDMNHFASDTENRRLDELALRTLDQLDPDALYATCHRHHISMCGMLPTVILLKTLQRLDALHQAMRVDYTTSAEVSGDRNRVVGYAGVLFD